MGEVQNTISGTVHGSVQQAGRDIQAATVLGSRDALAALWDLRAALSAAELTPAERDLAGRELRVLELELDSAVADRRQVLHSLERVTDLLKATGALAAAGAALAGPIGAIAGWLGPVGAGLLRTLRQPTAAPGPRRRPTL